MKKIIFTFLLFLLTATSHAKISNKEISESLIENGFEIDRQAIRLPEGVLKDLGNFELDIELHPEVISKINVLLKPEK